MIWQLIVETVAGPELFGAFPAWLNCELVRVLLDVAASECVAVPRPGARS